VPRQARLDAPGTLHHVIIRGIEKRQIVDDDKDRKNFVNRLGKLALETGTAIYAWVLMTNHAQFPFEKRTSWFVKVYEKISHRICCVL
jgi:hypothetical protein